MMWVKYQIDASIPMYEQLPVNTESKAREILLARNPGIKHCSINRTFTGINPPEWWPGEKEKKEAKRQEENRRREDERRARRDEEQRREAKRQEENRRREDERRTRRDEEQRREAKRQEENRRREDERRTKRIEERHKSENDKLRREMENLRKENRDIARKSRQSSGEFWSESQYENFTDRARDQKDGMYDKIMNCETNILTASIKLICWLLHEIFNPHSFFRQHIFSVVNVILVFAGFLAYKNEMMLFVILCAISVIVNGVIGIKTDRSGIALLIVLIEAAIFGVAIWMAQPQFFKQITLKSSVSEQQYNSSQTPPEAEKTVVASKNVDGRQSANTMMDSRDGREYKIVKIGNQTWFAENLNYKTKNSHCYQNIESNCKKNGRLYQTYEKNATKNVCPVGWHVPSFAEWKMLLKNVGLKQKCLKFWI